MKRTVAVLFCLLLICPLLLTGCHGKQTAKVFTVPDSFDTNRSYEITFWAKNDTNKAQTTIYQRAITEFQRIYPNITVNLRLYTDYNKIYNDVITNITTGTTPNVCITYPDHIATYLTGNNVVAPLDALIADEKYGLGGSEVGFDAPSKEEIITRYLDEGTFEGQTYAVPFMRSTEICYINKTFVEALGYTVPDVLTWDYIWEVADAATKKNADGTYAVNGQNVLIPFIYKSTDNMLIQMLAQKDAPYSTEDGEVLIFNNETKDLLETIREHTQTGAFSTFKISGYPANFLNAGQCIFAVDSSAGATWMGTDAPLSDISPDKLVRFETVVRMVPQFTPDTPKMISQGPSICIFNKEDSGEVLASWLFTQYLLTNDIQIAYAQTEGYVPVTQKARDDASYCDYLARGGEDTNLHYNVKIEATQLLIDHTEDTFVTNVFNGSASLRNAAGQMVESVTKSVRRKETIDDAYYEKLYADMTSMYHLDQIDGKAQDNGALGPLPMPALVLLVLLGATWLGLGVYALLDLRKRKKRA